MEVCGHRGSIHTHTFHGPRPDCSPQEQGRLTSPLRFFEKLSPEFLAYSPLSHDRVAAVS